MTKIKDFISNYYWYHTIKFPNGLTTKGIYNHLPVINYYQLPENMKGMSVLDVGAADGFFSFEFERRNAKTVLAIDTHTYDGNIGHPDISPAKINNYRQKYQRFAKENDSLKKICNKYHISSPTRILIAKKILHSRIKFKVDSIYNLSNWKKKFDLVFCGDLMEHLKNPLLALENLLYVTKKLCIICLSSCPPPNLASYFIGRMPNNYLEYHGNKAGGSFFHFYPKTFKEMCLAAGFKKVKIIAEFPLKNQKRGHLNYHAVLHCFP